MLSFADLNNREVFELATTVRILSSALQKGMNCSASTIYFQEYEAEDEKDPEKIPHFHVHVIARVERDLDKKDEINRFLAEHDKEFGNQLHPILQDQADQRQRDFRAKHRYAPFRCEEAERAGGSRDRIDTKGEAVMSFRSRFDVVLSF